MKRVFALHVGAEHAVHLLGSEELRIDPRVLQALHQAGDVLLLAAEVGPAFVIDEAETSPFLRQAHVGVVLTQAQTVFGAAGKHAVGLRHAASRQIVDHHAEIGLIAAGRPGAFAARVERGIETGEKPLCGGLFVTRRAVDLTGKEEAGHGLRLHAGLEAARIVEVVFNRIARTQQMRVLKAGHVVDDVELDVEGQAR